jgi:hypothetical protein
VRSRRRLPGCGTGPVPPVVAGLRSTYGVARCSGADGEASSTIAASITASTRARAARSRRSSPPARAALPALTPRSEPAQMAAWPAGSSCARRLEETAPTPTSANTAQLPRRTQLATDPRRPTRRRRSTRGRRRETRLDHPGERHKQLITQLDTLISEAHAE